MAPFVAQFVDTVVLHIAHVGNQRSNLVVVVYLAIISERLFSTCSVLRCPANPIESVQRAMRIRMCPVLLEERMPQH